MTYPVLLARPHTFIVSDMKPFLEAAGFSVTKAEKAEELADLSYGHVGAVISLAVSSSMEASPEEVIKILRQVRPTLPLLFAALLPYAKMKASLERIGQQVGLNSQVLGLADLEVQGAAWGRPAGLLYLSREDLAGSVTRPQAIQAVRSHFNLNRR